MTGQGADTGRRSEFGALLRHYRKEAGLSQEELAERAGLSVRGLSDLERGERHKAHPANARSLADALGLTAPQRAAFLAARDAAGVQPAPESPATVHSAGDLPRLPVPPYPLIGREHELATAVSILRHQETEPDSGAGTRLLTLTGPGGVGKTRLALAVAAEVAPSYIDGVHLVELAPVQDAGLVPSTIAQALGVRPTGDETPPAVLVRYLRGRRALLLLDNFEHVLAAATLVADLLAACPHLRVLVTSRSRLRLRGERELPVPPLSLRRETRDVSREGKDRAHVSRLTSHVSDAVRLFVARTQDVRPDFSLTTVNAAAVAEICHRLDGLPLALELAAARGKVLSPSALAAKLERRLPLLTGGAADLPARQQTLRATIAWSYDLLGPSEQSLFRRLAVFAGGCTLEMAEVICGDACPETTVLDGLTALVEYSLLRPDDPQRSSAEIALSPEPRFTMLETIREFALDALETAGEIVQVQRRHAAFFLLLAEGTESKLRSGERDPCLARLDVEHDNLRAALAFAVEQEEAATALRLAGALRWYWYFRGHFTEGRRWLAQALALPTSNQHIAYRAKALYGAGVLTYYQEQVEAARPLLFESVALWRAVADRHGLAHALVSLAIAIVDEDYPKAREYLEESIALFRELGDEWGLAFAASYLGAFAVWRPGEERLAWSALEGSAASFRRLNDPWGMSSSLFYLGVAHHLKGEVAAARNRIEESLGFARAAGDKWRVERTLSRLGVWAEADGDFRRAEAYLVDALALAREQGRLEHVADFLARLGVIAAATGEPERATRLVAAADGLCESLGVPPASTDDAYESDVVAVRARLGEKQFAAVWAAGKSAPWEQIVAEASAPTHEQAVTRDR